jgi:hypothetical protein
MIEPGAMSITAIVQDDTREIRVEGFDSALEV